MAAMNPLPPLRLWLSELGPLNPFAIIRSWFADPEYVSGVLASTLGAAVFLAFVYGLGGLR